MLDHSTQDGDHNEVWERYGAGTYWEKRLDLMYYRYVDFIGRTVGSEARSIIDIGTANCPYLEWFDWIPQRVSFDEAPPYSSDTVVGMQGDFLTHDFGRRFDICTCLQVLEHVPDPTTFAQKLLETSDLVVVSVPYQWPETAVDNHLHDPIDKVKLLGWFGRRPNYSIVVSEPFRALSRLIAVYHKDPKKRFSRPELNRRIQRQGIGSLATDADR